MPAGWTAPPGGPSVGAEPLGHVCKSRRASTPTRHRLPSDGLLLEAAFPSQIQIPGAGPGGSLERRPGAHPLPCTALREAFP